MRPSSSRHSTTPRASSRSPCACTAGAASSGRTASLRLNTHPDLPELVDGQVADLADLRARDDARADVAGRPVGSLEPQADGPHGRITVRNLLTMTSGLHWNGLRDYNIFTQRDRVHDALTLPVDHAPGTFFEYAQSPVSLLADMVGIAARKDVQAFGQQQLLSPLGIPADHWRWDRDATHHVGGFWGVNMRPDDYARLGELLRRGGVWKGRRLLSAEFVHDATSPTPTNGCYGWLIWVNRSAPCIGARVTNRPERQTREFPGAPANVYNFSGLFGQFVTVFPTQGLLIVRLGQDTGVNLTGGAGYESETLPADARGDHRPEGHARPGGGTAAHRARPKRGPGLPDRDRTPRPVPAGRDPGSAAAGRARARASRDPLAGRPPGESCRNRVGAALVPRCLARRGRRRLHRACTAGGGTQVSRLCRRARPWQAPAVPPDEAPPRSAAPGTRAHVPRDRDEHRRGGRHPGERDAARPPASLTRFSGLRADHRRRKATGTTARRRCRARRQIRSPACRPPSRPMRRAPRTSRPSARAWRTSSESQRCRSRAGRARPGGRA